MLLNPVRARCLAAVSLAAVTMVACSDDGGSAANNATKTVVVGSTPFVENVIMANIYQGALQNKGYQVTVRAGLGAREILLPALQSGGAENGVDLTPEYVGTLLEHVNKNAGEASGNLNESAAKLRTRLDAIGLTALEPSPAADQNAFAVTKATADRLKLKKLSDITPAVGGQLTLGAGPECPTRPFCQPGLEKSYGLKFKTFRVLDSCGPKTLEALSAGDIDIGLVCSSDGQVAARNLVVLEDDKKLQTVDNIIPVIRKDIVDNAIRDTLNKVSAALTTDDLIQLNKRAGIDKADPQVLAREWLQARGFAKKK